MSEICKYIDKAKPVENYGQKAMGLNMEEGDIEKGDVMATDKTFSIQSKQNLSVGNVIEAVIGLPPIPLLAKNSGSMLLALLTMTVDRGLNMRDVLLCIGIQYLPKNFCQHTTEQKSDLDAS